MALRPLSQVSRASSTCGKQCCWLAWGSEHCLRQHWAREEVVAGAVGALMFGTAVMGKQMVNRYELGPFFYWRVWYEGNLKRKVLCWSCRGLWHTWRRVMAKKIPKRGGGEEKKTWVEILSITAYIMHERWYYCQTKQHNKIKIKKVVGEPLLFILIVEGLFLFSP